ncbi:MAG: 30S ribosomal protein S4 [Dehalococcoidia bacterium]|nr:30S ribosomal protein S4 [Dehalococcoidia bacterium]
MARYTGPVCRICRRHGQKLFLKGDKCITNCTLEKPGRNNPPGQRMARRRKVSDRGIQWREKNKARSLYGVLERQFRGYYEDAVRQPGITGENLIRTLEMRLDNVVMRMGFADSRNQARQYIRHGLMAVNGRKVTIPSFQAKNGDEVGWSDRGHKSEAFKIQEGGIASATKASWVTVDETRMTGRVISEPRMMDTESLFDPAVIVEFYSR